MKARILLLSVAASIFVACGNENVEKVKNSTLRGLDTMTIGAAIEGSKICKSINYEDVSKDGLKAVKVTCDENSDQIKVRNDKLENKYNEAMQRYNQSVKNYDEALKNAIEKNQKDRDQAIARLQEKLEKSFTKTLSYDEILKISMDNCKANARNMTECDNNGILEALKAAGVEETKRGFWPLKSLPSNFAGVFGYHDEVLTLASRDRVGNGFSSVEKPKEAPAKPEAIKSAIREMNFIIKPDGSIERPRDIFEIIDGNKTEASYRILTEFYKR